MKEDDVVEYSEDGGKTWKPKLEYTNVKKVNGEVSQYDVKVRVTNNGVSTMIYNSYVKIKPAPLTVTTESASKVYDGTALTAGGKIEGLVNNEKADIATTGSITEVSQSGAQNGYTLTFKEDDDNYSAVASNYEVVTKNIGTLTITQRDVTIKANDNLGVIYDGQPHGENGYTVAEATANTGLVKDHKEADVKIAYTETNAGNYNDALTIDKNAVKIMSGAVDVTKNYNVIVEPGTLEIVPTDALTVVTIVGHNDTVVYNGAEQSVSGYDETIPDPTIALSLKQNTEAKASGTNAATYTMGLTADSFDARSINYTNIVLKVTDGYLTITQRPVTVTINSDVNVQYDGNAHTVAGADGKEWTIEAFDAAKNRGIVPGHEEALNVVYGDDAAENKTLAGEYDAKVDASGVKIEDVNGANVTANYAISVIPGKLKINSDDSILPDKTETSNPTIIGGYQLGEDILFTIKVQNITNKDIQNVTVTDPTAKIVAGTATPWIP